MAYAGAFHKQFFTANPESKVTEFRDEIAKFYTSKKHFQALRSIDILDLIRFLDHYDKYWKSRTADDQRTDPSLKFLAVWCEKSDGFDRLCQGRSGVFRGGLQVIETIREFRV